MPVLEQIAGALTRPDNNGNVSCLSIDEGDKDSLATIQRNPIFDIDRWKVQNHVDGEDDNRSIGTLTQSHIATLTSDMGRSFIHQCHITPACTNPACKGCDNCHGPASCSDEDHANPECKSCEICAAGGRELANALEGIKATTSLGPTGPVNPGADKMRVIYLKNLPTILDSLANHLEENGNTTDTNTDVAFVHDATSHSRAASVARALSQTIKTQAHRDYQESGRLGGFIHSDQIRKFPRTRSFVELPMSMLGWLRNKEVY
jgi:hypothetical protein